MYDWDEAFKRAEYFFQHEYHDRGMVKWQGYYLSDHTSDIKNKIAQAEGVLARRLGAEMDEEEIGALLFKAYAEKLRVRVQLALQDEDGIPEAPIEGIVEGYTDEAIVVGGHFCLYEELWRVDLVEDGDTKRG